MIGNYLNFENLSLLYVLRRGNIIIMKQKIKGGLVLFLFIFLIGLSCIEFINAAPPTTVVYGDFNTGYILKFPNDNVLKVGEDFEFEFHVYNKTSGFPVTENIGCYFHLYNYTGKHQLEMYDAIPSHHFDYSFDVPGENFQVGDYSYVAQCNNTDQGGFVEVPFIVTTTGRVISSSNTILPIIFIFLSILCFILGFSFNEQKWMMKSFFYLCSILGGLLALNSARIIASESLGLYSMGVLGLVLIIPLILVMFLYVAITYLTNVFKQLKDKREIRWKY